MCELLGMNANVPTDLCFSFAGLMRRGGHTGPHVDGWGVVFYEDKGIRAFHDQNPSARSEIAQFIRGYSIKSEIALCHIRKANRGRVALENTHPFVRELWGRNWSFAHNGQLRGVKKWPLDSFRPVGSTDSEHAFCWLLGQLRARWAEMPSPSMLRCALGELAGQIAQQGVFNMIMSDGKALYCFRSTHLVYLTRRAPFGAATLIDDDLSVDFSRVTSHSDVVTIIATKPLTRDEQWTSVEKNVLVVFRDGAISWGRPRQKAALPIGRGAIRKEVGAGCESTGARSPITPLRRGLAS